MSRLTQQQHLHTTSNRHTICLRKLIR